jgi:hypothetical protein
MNSLKRVSLIRIKKINLLLHDTKKLNSRTLKTDKRTVDWAKIHRTASWMASVEIFHENFSRETSLVALSLIFLRKLDRCPTFSKKKRS